MFQTGVRDGRAFPFILQLFVVPFLVGILALPLLGIFERLALNLFSTRDGSPVIAFEVVIWLGVGFGIGKLVSTYLEALSATGQWIWVVSTGLFIATFGSDILMQPPFVNVLSNYFYPTGSDEGFARALFTEPAFSAMGYSAGIVVADWLR
jgi:hypothetical protein